MNDRLNLRRLLAFSVLLVTSTVPTTAAVRNEIAIPDIPGYLTLKCDFHMHTVFSDGKVWPTVRVEEAWREGLDALAITDHIEYLPHRKDIQPNFNRSYEITQPAAEEKGLILIRGAEITRSMPPGHFNAIFLTDCTALETEEWQDAIKAAAEQGAYVFWNHPGWTGQQEDGKSRWYDEHTELYEKGLLQGIEVVNGSEYYPRAHKWAVEKKLAVIGNSDVHNPINLDYSFSEGEHRPITLVFARERTAAAVKEALVARRTAIYFKNTLIGDADFLNPMFAGSVETLNSRVKIKDKQTAHVRIRNKSEVEFELAADGEAHDILAARSITIEAGKTSLLSLKRRKNAPSGIKEIRIPYRVTNLWVAPETALRVELTLEVDFGSTAGQ